LPITSYKDLFPSDIEYQLWLLGFFINKKNIEFIINLDKLFICTINFDFFERLNNMHVVRSYINKFIWFGLKHFLYFYVYYHFPKYYYFPDYFKKNVLP